ncbi:sacsin N-terminal ATP-binding-like domain-containing protein [Oerskovia sp. USHLN155]|uniref:sacsin N-terminal ATP-binding-like domain-containing protein n=1 Tax=Oerskovia sp. USHLN155 TaxID=3081288 RepID=UPI00301844F5
MEQASIGTIDAPTSDYFRRRVEERANSEARLYLAGRDEDNPAVTELKDLIEGVIGPEYAGRTVLELLQNGHDAHDPSRRDGELRIILDVDEGEHGTLYAVNGGAPLSDENFRRMAGTGLSSKRPDNSIGNKGIGFKSVRELSAVPEVYSARGERIPGLTGYRFRFAAPGDFDEIARRVAPERAGLADELRSGLSSLRVPVPIDGAVPARVERLAEEAVSTVIRLPIRSADALESALAQIHEIESSTVPFHIFLERVELVSLEVVGGAEPRATTLTREEAPVSWAVQLSPFDVTVLERRLGDGHNYVVASHDVSEAEFMRAIEESCAAGQLNENWLTWRGPARVSVALPLDQCFDAGRLYTFLPMGDHAVAPVPGLVNAPFASRADRRTLMESVPVNALLLDSVARVCAALLDVGADDSSDVPSDVLVDAASWTAEPARLDGELKRLDRSLRTVPFIPALSRRRRRIAIDTAYVWPHSGTVLTVDAVAATDVIDVVDPALAAGRIDRVRQLCMAFGAVFEPPPQVFAACVEAVAQSLAADGTAGEVWADFYDDLAAIDAAPEALAGRAIVLDESGQAAAAGHAAGSPHVYFAPRQTDDDAAAIPLPGVLRTRVVFAAPDVPDRVEGRPTQRPGRSWLARHGLVSEYRTESVLEAVSRTMEELTAAPDENDASLHECLLFAFALNRRGSREVSDATLEALELHVPVRSGWARATDARFGAGWGGADVDIDNALVRLLTNAGDGSAELQLHSDSLLRAPHELLPEPDDLAVSDLGRFLAAIGVRHGLWPVALKRRPRSRYHADLTKPRGAEILGDLPMIGFDADDWRSLAERWPGRTPQQYSTEYRARGGWWVLPGQAEFAALSAEGQRTYSELVVLGLGQWPDEALEVRYVRQTDPVGAVWPTPLAAFLAAAAWVPQTIPGDRATITLTTPAESWWLAEIDTVDFLPAQPARLRRVNSRAFLERIARLGLRIWDWADTARQRLDHLTEMVRAGGLDPRTTLSVRKAVEAGWSALVDQTSFIEVPKDVVAYSRRELRVVPTTSDHEPVYVVDVDDSRRRNLIEASRLNVLPIRDIRLGRAVFKVLRREGANVRSVADAPMTVTVDGIPVSQTPKRQLLDSETGWLTSLAVGLLELRYSAFPPLTPNVIAAAIDRIEQAQVVVGHLVTVSIGEAAVPLTDSASLYLPDDGVIVVRCADDSGWQVLAASADSIVQLLGAPSTMADTLLLALTSLRTADLSGDTTAAVAQALRVDEHELRGVLHLADPGIDTSATVFVLMCVAPSIGYELHELETPIRDDASLRDWLSSHLAVGDADADRVLRFSLTTDRGEVLTELGADLSSVNEHLRSVQLAELENGAAQAQQFRAYLQERGAVLRDRLRDRFVSTARSGGDLSDYVRLTGQLASIDVDPDWVKTRWTVDAATMDDHVTQWLDAQAPGVDPDAEAMAAVDVTRADAQNSLRSVLGRLPALIAAWQFGEGDTSGTKPLDVPQFVAEVTASGRLDFGRLTPTEIVARLKAQGQWPAAMPGFTTASELKIAQSELDAARARIKEREEAARRATTTLTFKDVTFTAENDEMVRLYETVRRSVHEGILETPRDPVDLAITSTDDAPASRRGSSTRRGAWQAQGAPPEKTKLIGLMGEAIVGRWIEEQFELSPTDTWVSGYRQSVLADGIGNDSLGFDFRVETADRTLLIEVKASLGDDRRFELGESEVRRAQDLADDEEYRIVFVVNVADLENARIYPLPNPFALGGLQRYRVVGRSMSLQFDLDP